MFDHVGNFALTQTDLETTTGTTTRPERFELPTFGSVDRRSIQLSYGRLAADSSPAVSVAAARSTDRPSSRARSRRAAQPRGPIAHGGRTRRCGATA